MGVKLLTSGELKKGWAVTLAGPLKNGNATHLVNFQDGNSQTANQAWPLLSTGLGVTL